MDRPRGSFRREHRRAGTRKRELILFSFVDPELGHRGSSRSMGFPDYVIPQPPADSPSGRRNSIHEETRLVIYFSVDEESSVLLHRKSSSFTTLLRVTGYGSALAKPGGFIGTGRMMSTKKNDWRFGYGKRVFDFDFKSD